MKKKEELEYDKGKNNKENTLKYINIKEKEKKRIRNEMKAKRNALSKEQIEQAANDCFRQLIAFPEFQKTKWVYPYMSYRGEVDTIQMIPEFLRMGKHVAVPKVRGEEMDFYEISSLEECRPGAFGILEPDEITAPPVTEAGWILLPGLAFDKTGNRLGYGGGFYDKYLEKHENLVRAALAYDFQIVSSLPKENYDMPADYIITPKTVWECF